MSYRLDPETARTLVPAPLRPQLVNGQALAGFCVLGLDGIRPRWVPARVGLRSENAAHRIAVEWDDDGVVRSGVYILERHSSAWHPVLFGGRLFPGVHRRARFATDERGDRYAMTMDAEGEHLAADVEVGGAWASSVFASVEEASAFYRAGRIGWSLGHDGVTLEAVALAAEEWAVEGARIRGVRSSFFDALPDGAAELDHVVVMRDLEITMEAPITGAPTGAPTGARAAA